MAERAFTMSHAHWTVCAVLAACLLFASGCAREAEEKVAEAGQDLQQAWEAEKAAAAAELRKSVDAISEDIAGIRARAAELEAKGEAAAAAAWHGAADRMAAARDAAAREIRALEDAGADAWQAASDSASAAVAKLGDTWETEKAAAVAAMKKTVDAASEKAAAMRARAVELEKAGAAAAADAWHRMADGLETARDAAAREVRAVEDAAAGALHVAVGTAAVAVVGVEELLSHAAAFTADAWHDFVAGARSIVEKSERELAWAKQKLIDAEEAAEEEWHVIVAELEEKQQAAAAELKKIEEAGEDAWSEMAHGFVAAYHDLRDASRRAVDRLGEI